MSKATIAKLIGILASGTTKILVFLSSHFGGLRIIDPLLSALSDKYGLFLTYDATKLDSNPINLSNREASDILKIQLSPQSENFKAKFEHKTLELNNPYGSKLAIILQGAMIHKNDFTLRIVKRYLKTFSGAVIILSTWDDEDTSAFLSLACPDSFKIVKSSKPENTGVSNFNLQLISTLAGLKIAQGLNCEFVLKTRTDQALMNPEALQHIDFVFHKYSGNNENGRIVAASRNTFLYRLYGISDMFLFGSIVEMQKFWQVPQDLRIRESQQLSTNSTQVTLRNYSKEELVEVYLVANYLRKKNLEPKFTLEDSIKAYRDHFIILDSGTLGLIWNKYTRNANRWSKEFVPNPHYEVTFLDWLKMQDCIGQYLEYEEIIDMDVSTFQD